MDPTGDSGTDLERRIRRIQTALTVATAARFPLETSTRAAARALESARRMRREERKHRHEERDSEHGLGSGIVQGVAALAMGGFALIHPDLWWLFFPAVGFGTKSARLISRALARRPDVLPVSAPSASQTLATAPAPTIEATTPAPSDPRSAGIALRVARVDDICKKMFAELKSAPALVREMLRKPEETVQALQSASHELARRERELRAAITDEDERRLRQERTELQTRVTSEPDEVVRVRLASALESLDAQLSHRAELGTLASRIEAEGTRILYSLENLRAKVLRASVADSASPDLAGEGLRDGLEQLSREMDAVATALEEVHGTEAARRPVPVPQALRG